MSHLLRLGAEPIAEGGGKANGLARLVALGLPVPPAFVVRASAHRLLVGAPDPEAALSDLIGSELDAALGAVGPGPWAVRSSGLAEDGSTQSFAGQHDTVLDVADAAGVRAAIVRCWASAGSERAVAYRRQAGLSDDAAVMGVVVQRMVKADAAGVLFTRNPTTGADELVVEAIAGLGEALVSGKAAPDRFVLRRPGLEVTERQVVGGAPVSEALLRSLAEMALRIEASEGIAQDVEWAVEGGIPWLLQARPITTTAIGESADSQGAHLVWSNTNTGELLPDPATPLTFSVTQRYVRMLLGPVLDALGADLGNAPIIGLVGGRVYFCLNTLLAMFRALPGMSRRTPADMFGGDATLMREAIAAVESGPNARVRLRWTRAAVGLPRLLFGLLRHQGVRPASDFQRIVVQTERFAADDPGALDGPALVARIDRMFDLVDEEIREPFHATLVGTLCVNVLNELCRRWLGDRVGTFASTLFAGMGGVDSAESGLALWRLALSARAPDLAGVVLSERSWPEVEADLSRSDAGRAFLQDWSAYLARHGHHARAEVDVAVPRWREEPDVVLGNLRALARAPAGVDPVQVHARRAEERVAAERTAAARLGPIRRRVFEAFLRRAQRGMVLRENLKSELMRRHAVLRETLLASGRRLVCHNLLASPDDVFFLSLEELRDALVGRLPGAGDRVTRAKKAFATASALHPPQIVIGLLDPTKALPKPPSTARRLTGLSVSPGLVEGVARVILRPDHTARIEPGEILVAPFTDPGWAPYFVAAAGLVVDMGGMLSHGSIVAREYGIPAVVNVGDGTRAIRSGQRIRVDANAGVVVVLE